MKNSSLALLAGVASVTCLFAFTVPSATADRFLSVLFPESAPGMVPFRTNESRISDHESRIADARFTMQTDTFDPLEDRDGSFLTPGSNNPIDLKDPAAVEQRVEYDPVTNKYIIEEKIGDEYFRTPTYMNFDEYVKFREKKQREEYFDKLNGVVVDGKKSDGLGIGDPVKRFDIKTSLVDRLFGGTQVNIEPQGNINLTFGVNHQKVQNPILTLRQQRSTIFDFDMDINMSAQGKIGEKLNLNFNYNTQATFDFDNQMKLNYDTKNFSEDEIFQGVQAGNVSMPLKSNLIQGAQRLFGLKTDMKFGHLRLTTVASQQQSRRQNLSVQGGSQLQLFDVPIDNYDADRHFFLTHYNRNTFEPSLRCLPNATNLFTVTRMEVWITNDVNRTENTRDIIAIADLAEPKPFLNQFETPQTEKDIYGAGLPWNGANGIWPQFASELRADSTLRFSNKVIAELQSKYGMRQIIDFEKARARLLSTSEYNFHEQLGFVSLNLNVQPDQTVGVAVEYLYNGKPYRIGEFSNDVIMGDTLNQNVIFTKMLKSTNANVRLPIWDLMMKNVYSVGATNVDPKEFKFDIFYDDPGKGQKRFLDNPEIGNSINSRPLLQLFRLDTLNVQGDPGPDGIFDFVPGLTFNQRSGRVMFPVLEPFGSHLDKLMRNSGMDSVTASKYVYQQLYDSTLFRAREYQQLNRFALRGSYKGSNSSRISLGSFNVPRGSVKVTGGGRQMVEGVDYEVDYNLGQVTILNDAITQSGQQVQVSFEDNALFGIQNRTMLGVRADYEFSKDLTVGGTFMNLFERPLTQKVNFGDDPINNKVYGADINLTKKAPFLTKMVDRLPFYSTKAESTVNFQAEVAALRPGHARAINNGPDKGGVVFVDDFEGSTSSIPLANPANAWTIASVPQYHPEGLFPESAEIDTFLNGVNRSKLSWYIADPSARNSTTDRIDPYTRIIQFDEIFPNRQLTPLEQSFIRPLDVTIFPRERGPYNFDRPEQSGVPAGTAFSSGLEIDGSLRDPETRWAGFMRGLNQNDFEASNIEFVEFWMLNPYMDKADGSPVSEDGSMYIDLGSVSEDIMRDSRQFFENAIPAVASGGIAETQWGRVPAIAPVVNAFDNEPTARGKQDVGLDGLDNAGEAGYFTNYMAAIRASTLSANAKAAIEADPSNDDFVYFLDAKFIDPTNLLTRYKSFNNPQGNSPVNNTSNLNPSSTNFPDREDLNQDNTLNESEAYFQYKIKFKKALSPSGNPVLDMQDSQLDRLITDTVTYMKDGLEYVWYRFRMPLDNPDRKAVGGIQDLRSIRFIRTYFTEFTEATTFRFATLELGRNQWRRYKQNTNYCDANNDQVTLELNAVNVEENSARTPFNYVLPNGVRREQSVGAFPDVLQNEQSLSMRVCNLAFCQSQAVFKPLNMDLRLYEYMKMYVHAEPLDSQIVKPGMASMFVRIGSDYVNNYYEYEIPLTMSDSSKVLGRVSTDTAYRAAVWPLENTIQIKMADLIQIKENRNLANLPLSTRYEEADPSNSANLIRIVGNPNLGLVKGAMIGIRNTDTATTQVLCIEAWVNELRMTGFNERAGYAALARMDVRLADLGNVSLSGNYASIGWGSLEQKIQQRSREEVLQGDVSANVELGKFLPEKAGVRLPLYAQYSNVTKNPEFDPYDLDIRLKDKLANVTDREARDSIRTQAQDVTITRGYNLTNVRKERVGKPRKVPLPWNVENFSLSYARNQQIKRNPLVLNDELNQYKGALDYKYTPKGRNILPLKKLIKKDKYLKFLTDFNFNPIPSNFGFNSTMERFANSTTYRFAGEDPALNTYYNRRFTWDRNYNFNWDLAKSLKFTFDATARSLIDEPYQYGPDGLPVTREQRRDSIITNIKSLGRPKNYNHSMSLNYTLPFKSIPFMDWVTVRASYTGGYTWNANSLKLQDLGSTGSRSIPTSSLGNIAQNNSTRQINGDLNFEQLYNKSKYLSQINKPKGKKSPNGSKAKKANGDSGAEPIPGDPGGRGREEMGGGSGDDISVAGNPRDKAKRGDAKQKAADERKKEEEAKAKDNKRGDITKAGEPVLGKDGKPLLDKDGKPVLSTEEKFAEGDKKKKATAKDKKDKKREPSMAERIALRPLMLVRKGRLTYSETYATVLPGFVPEAKILGMSDGFIAPGLPFIAGFTPTDAWAREASDREWVTQRPELNQQFTRNFNTNLDAQLTVEPINDFRVELSANRQFTRNNSELYKDQNFDLSPDSIGFESRGSRDMGNLTVSYFTLNTLFGNDLYGLFDRFADNRAVMSNRLGVIAGNTNQHQVDGPGYLAGYGKVQTDVLMPAFLAAYTKTDPTSQRLDVFKTTPKPNWRLSYNGLNKVGDLGKVFSSIQISHGYKNTLSMNSYQTDIFYDRDRPQQLDTLNFNYIARYEIPQLTITESMAPLLGIDVKTKGGMTARLDMKKSRTLALSFVDYNLVESNTSAYTFGFGYKVKKVNIPFLTGQKKQKGKKKANAPESKIDNLLGGASRKGKKSGSGDMGDLSFKFDFEYRDDITVNHRLELSSEPIPTRGTRTISINPSIDYNISSNLKLRLFTDYRRTVPKVSSAFPITTFNTGVTVQFSL
jgi:cell surface protein SprA